MALSYKARRGWSLVILLIGLPVYVVVAVTLLNLLERPPLWLELLLYVALGFLWMLPFRFVFKGIGQADPDAEKADREPPSA
ncbi:DUF2842 domain-containing protein [Tabrizicola sp.]|uniref:DUF2842 domain-containing protein n=1 Tax=Tabrizicola sp. TaxID=2005166 RepID=UPI00286C873F|nr:DUF2842 domain-containing protein [Tabrizicola sp.]